MPVLDAKVWTFLFLALIFFASLCSFIVARTRMGLNTPLADVRVHFGDAWQHHVLSTCIISPHKVKTKTCKGFFFLQIDLVAEHRPDPTVGRNASKVRRSPSSLARPSIRPNYPISHRGIKSEWTQTLSISRVSVVMCCPAHCKSRQRLNMIYSSSAKVRGVGLK